jgi:predicted peptidase
MPYLYYLPKDYKSDRQKRRPLMLFLHGAGERGTNVSRVTMHGPLKLPSTKAANSILSSLRRVNLARCPNKMYPMAR